MQELSSLRKGQKTNLLTTVTNFGKLVQSYRWVNKTNYPKLYNLKGSIGSRGIDPNFKSVAAKNLSKEKLYIKGVEDVFTSILEKYEDLEIVVKMDCEGAEYPILETLSNSGQLNRIKIIVME
jgi:hypothetical protein